MRRLFIFPALLLAVSAVDRPAAGQNGATTTVVVNPATTTVGGTGGFTATIQPENVSISPGLHGNG